MRPGGRGERHQRRGVLSVRGRPPREAETGPFGPCAPLRHGAVPTSRRPAPPATLGRPEPHLYCRDCRCESQRRTLSDLLSERVGAVDDQRSQCCPLVGRRTVVPPLQQGSHVRAAGRSHDSRAERPEGGVGVLAQSELADGFTHDPVAAALVAEQVAPPAGALLAVSGNTDGDRTCACICRRSPR